jgi:type II secretory pathway component PulF
MHPKSVIHTIPQRSKINKRIHQDLVIAFTESLSALLAAGLPLQDALSVCSDISGKKQIASLCTQLKKVIMEGRRFHTALALFSPSFSSLYINLVKIGESTGSISKVFDRLTRYLKRNRDVKQKIMEALAYPITVCVTALAIAIFILIFVFPRIKTVTDIFRSDVPYPDKTASGLLLATADSSSAPQYLLIAGGLIILSLAAFLALQFLFPFFSHTPSFSSFKNSKIMISRAILHIPFVGSAVKTFCTSDFAFSMEILCSAGIPFMHAMEQSSQVISNAAFKEALINAAHSISQGISITASFKMQKIFPEYITSWIGIGESTGSVEQVFSQIHSYFEHESSLVISNTLAASQPIFILIAGLIVIALIWQLVLPIFTLIGGL